MNIPTIEKLRDIAAEAGRKAETGMMLTDQVTAIRDAMIAACRPQLRPIAEMPNEVPEGCVRIFVGRYFEERRWIASGTRYPEDTHFIDITLPIDTYPADFEAAFAESKLSPKVKDAAFKLWKGGAR